MEKDKFFAGKLETIGDYQAFIPEFINHEIVFHDNKTLMLLEKASAILGKLNFLCQEHKGLAMYVNMLVMLEALSSSKIEGTHADAEEIILSQEKSMNESSQEVFNQFKAILNYKDSLDLGDNSDITSIDFIEKINNSLFENIKHKERLVGKIRKGQNYIGGTNELDALFVPPPAKLIKNLLEDLDNFWNNKTFYIPLLIKIALYHYQFETIHPFNDGNGRTGRILINLQLKQSNLLDLPILCLSDYWSRNKGLYYNALTTVRFSHYIEYWIRFFLQSIINTCEERIDTITKLLKLQEKCTKEIELASKSPTKHKELFNYLLEHQHITVKKAEEILKVSYQVANKIIQDFVDLKILEIKNDNKRNRVFIFKEYFDLVFKSIV